MTTTTEQTLLTVARLKAAVMDAWGCGPKLDHEGTMPEISLKRAAEMRRKAFALLGRAYTDASYPGIAEAIGCAHGGIVNHISGASMLVGAQTKTARYFRSLVAKGLDAIEDFDAAFGDRQLRAIAAPLTEAA